MLESMDGPPHSAESRLSGPARSKRAGACGPSTLRDEPAWLPLGARATRRDFGPEVKGRTCGTGPARLTVVNLALAAVDLF